MTAIREKDWNFILLVDITFLHFQHTRSGKEIYVVHKIF